MVKVNSCMKMEGDTKETIIKISKMVLELLHGLMAENMLENGKMDLSMVKVNILMQMDLRRNLFGIRDEKNSRI